MSTRRQKYPVEVEKYVGWWLLSGQTASDGWENEEVSRQRDRHLHVLYTSKTMRTNGSRSVLGELRPGCGG